MGSYRVAQILAGVVAGSGDGAGMTGRLVAACAQAIPVSGVGLVLMTDAGPAGTVAATDGAAATMEDLQFTLGEGPGVECSRTGRPVLQPDLAQTGPARWPAFCADAEDAGIRAVFAFPLRVGGIRLGVLDLCRDRPGALTDDDLAEALSFADAATAVLLDLQAHSFPVAGNPGPIPMVEDRAVVHQATGMISVQVDVTLTQALVLLRARAYANGSPINALARDVVGRVVRFTNDEGDRLDGH